MPPIIAAATAWATDLSALPVMQPIQTEQSLRDRQEDETGSHSAAEQCYLIPTEEVVLESLPRR